MKKRIIATLLTGMLFVSVFSGTAFAATKKPKKPASSRSSAEVAQIKRVISTGLALLATPYRRAGTSPKGFDCSGFTRYVYKKGAALELPHSSLSQSKMGEAVSVNELTPGDLVYFNTNGRSVSHVGIYVGKNKFIHASSSKGITVTSLSESYYSKRYMGARRVRF